MKQTKIQSGIEAATQTVVAFGLATLIQPIVFKLWDIHVNYGESMQIAVVFTLVSLVRSYIVRRVFNAYHHRS